MHIYHQSIVGKYEAKFSSNNEHLPAHYYLIINQDKSFHFKLKTLDGSASCTGKWKEVNNELLLFRCNESENLLDKISSGYLGDQTYEVRILNKNKIKFGVNTLVKVE